MLCTTLKIGNVLVIAIPVFLLAYPLSKDPIAISIGKYEGRTMPIDLMMMFINATDEPDDLQDCMMDFAKCIAVHMEIPFCGKTVDGTKIMNFTSICHLAYENCKLGSPIWQSNEDNKKYCPTFIYGKL